MDNQRPKYLIPASEARRILHVSPYKMAQLIKENTIRTYPNLLDRRTKLVSRGEVLALIPNAEAA